MPEQPTSVFDLMNQEDPAKAPGISSQTGEGGSVFDLMTGGVDIAGNTQQKATPEQQSESNTLWGNAKAETVVGELGAGIQSGVRQVLSTGPALAGLGASYFDEGLAGAMMEWSKQIAEGGAQRGIARVEDLTADPMSWARYVAGVTGEAVPFVLAIMSGAGAGTTIANMLGRKGVNSATRNMIMSSAPAFGGAFATGAAIETAATAQELFSADGQIRPLASLAAGSAKGALESIFPMVLGRQFGLTMGQSSDLYSRLIGGLATAGGGLLGKIGVGVGTEALTELAQEEIDLQTRAFFDENYGRMSPEAWSRRLNAMVAGGVGGGVLSSIVPGERPQTILADSVIRDAVGETPIYFGANPDEIPLAGPEHIIRTAGSGLDATAGLATGALLDQSLGDVDLRSRGLYSAVVPGRDFTFGSQDQANNDNDYYQGTGFLRLDPTKISRGDVTASAEDLPSTLNDPRVDFLNKETMAEASSKLASAIAQKENAQAATRVQIREARLQAAASLYREAVNLGARVEPMSDGQMILRDPAKAQQLAVGQANVDPQVSRATLLETRKREDGKGEFYVMASGSPKARKRPGGKALDLENVSPDDITAFPTRDLARQVLASKQIARQLDIGSARARGIRFLPSVQNPQVALQELVNILQSMSQSVRFYKQQKGVVERFMNLVDQGLRLDVAPDSEEFAVLRQVRGRELVDKLRDDAGPEILTDAGTKTIVKQRAKRDRESRVGRTINFSDPKVEVLFHSQFHNTSLQRLITGRLSERGVKEEGRPFTSYSQVVGSSPLLNFLRDLARSMGLKTDFLIEVAAPGALGENTGVKYIEDKRTLTLGGKEQSRSILQIDPWRYGRPTEGQKPLVKSPERKQHSFVRKPLGDQKIGDMIMIAPAAANFLKKTGVSVSDFKAQYPNATHFTMIHNGDSTWRITDTGTYQQVRNRLEQSSGEALAEVQDAGEHKDWLKGTATERPPLPKAKPSVAGKLAEKLGTPGTKMFSEEMDVLLFYTDFTRALGEVIVRYEWDNLKAGEQDLIQTAYKREENAARSLTPTQALARTFAHPVLARVLDERGRKSDLYNFEEWLFQQISRTLINPKTQIGPLQKFLTKTARGLLQMLEKAAKLTGVPWDFDRKNGQAAEEVQKWMERLALRGTAKNTDEPFLLQGTLDKVLKSIADNQDALKGWNLEYVAATPQRASTLQVRKLLEYIPEDATQDRKKLEALLASADRHNTILEWMLGIHQLADLNGHIEPLRRYVSLGRAMEDDALSWATMADERIRQAQKLPKVQQQALWALMNDLDQMTYLNPKLLQEKKVQPRWPTGEELVTLVRKHNLTAETFEVYKNIRTDYLSFLAQLEITGIRNAEETITDPAKLDEKVKEISGEIAQMRKRPYFPHMRFGKYIVTVKDNSGVVKFFAAFDTAKARDEALGQITRQWQVPQTNRIVSDEMSPTMQQFQGLPKFALNEVKKALGLDAPELTESQRRDRDALEALTFDAAPINSFRHNLSDRKNTPGYSMDGMRAYGTYFARSAKFVARMGYSHRLQEAIKDVRRTASPVSRDTRTRIADYMQRHFDAEMNPAPEWATARSLAFMWYFAFVPSAAWINLSQVPIVTYPYLASKFGGVKRGISNAALESISKNSKEMWSWARGKDKESRLKDGPKQEALDEAHASRVLDDGYAQELAAVSQGGVLSRTIADGKFARGVRHLAQMGTYPFASAERFNRSVTFRAAYDLAIADPDNLYVQEAMVKNAEEAARLRIDRGWPDYQIAAYIFAAQSVRDTQFEYARWARPKIMQGGRGVFFMFKTYLQNMLFFMYNANRGTRVRQMLILMGVAGLMGMPGAEDAEELVKKLGKLMGLDVNPQMWLRRMVKEFVGGSQTADVLLHGASRVGFGIPAALNGLGIPSGSADLSGSLGMGRLIPGLSAGLKAENSRFSEMLGDVTKDIAGPALGVPFNMYQALTDQNLPADDPKRWERAMPTALRNVTRSSRYLAEQRERDTRGATVAQFDPNDVSDQLDALGMGLGFQPTQVTRQWDAIEAQRNVQMYWKGQRKILMDDYGRATRLKDVEGKQDAKSAIRDFNKNVPYSSMKITADSLQKSIAARRREKEAKESRTPVAKSLRGVSRETQELFPEAPPPRGLRRLAIPSDQGGLPAGPTVVQEKPVR